MLRHAVAALAAGIALAGCAGCASGSDQSTGTPQSTQSAQSTQSTPKPVPVAALDGLLLNVGDINAIMGTTLTPDAPFTEMSDHRNLLPNLNCLGIVSIGETAIYGPSQFAGVRGQKLREPDNDNWNSQVIQAVVSYLSADAARKFYADSSDRWSKCSNHRVNLSFGDHPRTMYSFGTLTRTDTELTMPLSRTGDGDRTCQRALEVVNNVIIDVAACGQTITDQASSIAGKIAARIPA